MPAGTVFTATARELIAYLFIAGVVFIWSAIGCYDRTVWLMEVLPVIIAVPLMARSRRRFPFTRLVYILILTHAVILMVGGHYTYARVPLFNWLRDTLDLSRNHYDRVGHFAQGFVPAMIAREVFLRTSPLRPGKWLFFMVTTTCLAISAFYEFIEWWVAIASKSGASDFLATQGDIWDTQWDMFLAFCGAISAQLFLGRAHLRQLGL